MQFIGLMQSLHLLHNMRDFVHIHLTQYRMFLLGILSLVDPYCVHMSYLVPRPPLE
jgi:hypothetical protein